MKTLVKVVVPIYKTNLSAIEQSAFAHNMRLLERYPRVVVKPDYLDVTDFLKEYPNVEVLSVTSNWLGNVRGIEGYNDMMTSIDFYRLFDDCEYILICQTDAWIFRDELEEWCKQGYDYVAAPWPKRPVYNRFPVRQWLWLRRAIHGRNRLNILRQYMFNRIGNGGLSLRRVPSFMAACEKYAYEIAYFAERKHHLYHEDVFWALIPQEFKYPTVNEALKFSFDVKPEFCYELAGRKLPFGCHGFTYPRIYEFWKNIIPVDKREKSSIG